jgi:hypothetical protein
MPRRPAPRDRAHTAPELDPGLRGNGVPYVRDGHWYGHAAPTDARFQLTHPFQLGQFAATGPAHVFSVTRSDLGARRVWLGGGQFAIANWEWAVTAPWCWTCDSFTVYLDPDHPGWYLLYDAPLGEYVHAQYMGT